MPLAGSSLNIFNMDISLIGANAGSVWNALHENGELDLTKLKKETKLSEIEILAAIGWLAREGKVKSQKKQRKDVKPLNFSLWQINKNVVSHILTHPIFIFS